MTDREFTEDAIADRVNCYMLASWLEALSDRSGVPLDIPLAIGRRRVEIPIVRRGITVTLFRREIDVHPERERLVFHRVTFNPDKTDLPFGLDGRKITPGRAKRLLSGDTAGGRSIDFKRGNTRISHFLPEDARVVELTFNSTLVGLSACTVFRLGGEIPYPTLAARFGSNRLGDR